MSWGILRSQKMSRVEEIKKSEKATTDLMLKLAQKDFEYERILDSAMLNTLSDLNMSLARIVDALEAKN